MLLDEGLFEELMLATNWIYGFCAIEMSVLINDVIQLWLGDKYIINNWGFVFAVVFSFYVFGVNFVASSYRITMGFFREARLVPFIASIINIILSIYLGKRIGLTGIFIATCVSRILTFNTIDALLVIKKGLQAKASKYFIFQAGFLCVIIVTTIICNTIIGYIDLSSRILDLLVKIIVVALIANIVFFLAYSKTEIFTRLRNRVLSSFN